MKKLLTLALIAAMALSSTVTAFATEITQDSDPKTGSTAVTYSVDPTYTVTIPDTVKLGETATISAKDVKVAKGSQVEVALTGTSDNDNEFTLTTDEGAEIIYTVKDSQSTEIKVGDTVLTVNPDNGTTGSTTLSFVVPTTTQFAGDYTGTVTFTVSVESTTTGVTVDEEWGEEIIIGF